MDMRNQIKKMKQNMNMAKKKGFGGRSDVL